MGRRIKTVVQQAVQRITAWSYSRWQDYEQCPAKAKYKHVMRLQEPSNAAMDNGQIVHSLAAQHIRGDLKACPPEVKKLKDGMVQLKKAKAQVEQEWAFNSQWKPVSWFDKTAWCRIKVDAFALTSTKQGRRTVTTVQVVDHKTGREKPEHAMQRSLYAVGAFIMYPDAELVVAEHWYVDTGVRRPETFKRSQLDTLLRQWEQRTRSMLADTRFAPRAGSYCRWCYYRKENGGPCQY